jgi:hypothetical protein
MSTEPEDLPETEADEEESEPESEPRRPEPKKRPAIPVPGHPLLRVPVAARTFKVGRLILGTDAEWETCAIPQNGLRVERFHVKRPSEDNPCGEPHPDLIRACWGSGRYRVIFQREGSGAAGRWRDIVIDDPAAPRKPAYAGPAPELPALPAPSAAPTIPSPAEALARLGGEDGRVGLADVMALMQFQEGLRVAREAEDERRRQRERDDFEDRLRRERQEHELSMQRISASWSQTMRAQREILLQAQQDASDTDDLREEIASLREAIGQPPPGTVTMRDLIEAVPAVVAALKGGAPPSGEAA